MKELLYPRLAVGGLRRNARFSLPYLLSCAAMAAMLYLIAYLANSQQAFAFSGGATTRYILMLGQYVIAVFAAIFLFYTNSFLLRRREAEFGLYSVLGMDRGAIGGVLAWENALTYLFTMLVGLLLGAGVGAFAEQGMLRLLRQDGVMQLRVDMDALSFTAEAFAIIFALLFFSALWRLRRTTGASLLKSENVGEKPPRSNWLLVIPGVGLLGGAYYLAVTITDPVAVVLLFFIAVLMVIAGTYLLFVAGSVTLCRTLQKNRDYYYQKRHFISLSSMAYRMKRNGASLASICVLATMVLVMIGSSASLYFGSEEMLRTMAERGGQTSLRQLREEFYSMYGALFFLGIVLSIVFLLATALMLYYKQLSEGYEDQRRYAIMRRVGMTRADIRESVNDQMRTVFLLPLGAALLHLGFAQPMVWRMLQMFGLENLLLVLGITGAAFVIFALIYCLMYRLTSNAYVSIVSSNY